LSLIENKKTFLPWKIVCWVTIFAISMGFLETSVVVYLRALLYPGGFSFPLFPIPHTLAITEISREAATLIMLIGIGYLSGRSGISRFAYFLYSFAIWDIFYYIFLKVLLNWPENLMTWDILFLIPITWVGPVLSPIIVAITMAIFSLIILYFDSKCINVKIRWIEWSLLITGSLITILAFTWDYSSFILEHYKFSEIWSLPTDDMFNLAMKYIPRKFNWLLFIIGELTILLAIVLFYLKNNKIYNAENIRKWRN
jgi:hypothetical protein